MPMSLGKPSFDPSLLSVLKLGCVPRGAEVKCTGLIWRGPQGGFWVELADVQPCENIQGSGWLLLKTGSDGGCFGVPAGEILLEPCCTNANPEIHGGAKVLLSEADPETA